MELRQDRPNVFKSRDFIEIMIGYALIMVAEWTPVSAQRFLFWVTLAWVVVATVLLHQSARTLGLNPPNALRSFWIVPIAFLLSAFAVWIAAQMHALHQFSYGVLMGSRFWGYLLWTFLQQFMLQDYFLLRFLRLRLNERAAVWIAALLFASAHIPNPLLVPATLLWGLVACKYFLRYRDLYSIGLAQGILGMCIAVTVPVAVHHEMHVGRGYFQYRRPAHATHINHIDQPDRPTVSTDAWVTADALIAETPNQKEKLVCK